MFLGCGCKNKIQTTTKIINEEIHIVSEPLEAMIGDDQPPFTREEIERAMDYLNGITNSYEEKIFLYEFHNRYFREQLKPSCSVCIPRIQDRINSMLKILNDYDKKNL
jgi:hypothetical protein